MAHVKGGSKYDSHWTNTCLLAFGKAHPPSLRQLNQEFKIDIGILLAFVSKTIKNEIHSENYALFLICELVLWYYLNH